MKIFLILVVSVMILPVFASSHLQYLGVEPPLKQLASGIEPPKIICNEGFELIFKSQNGFPACVTGPTLIKLVERGWGTITSIPWIPNTSAITNFEECASAGNPIMESYPRQCRTADGKHFVEDISRLEVTVEGDKLVRRGTTHTLEIMVLRDEIPVDRARVFIDIEDYGEDIIKEFDGHTDSQGIFIFSWEIPQSFDDIETLLAFIDVTDDISAKTVLFKFQVYCQPGEKDCKVEGN